MPDDDRTTERSENVEGRPETEGAPGTLRGRAGTAGTEGENVARADRDPRRADDANEAATARGGGRRTREPARDETRGHERGTRAAGRGGDRPEQHTDEGTGATRMHGEVEGSEEGIAGEGIDESGTLPGSTGGVTGTGGHSGGEQSPGSTDPGFPGMSAEEAERRRERGREQDRRK